MRIERKRTVILCLLRKALPEANNKHKDKKSSLMQGQSGHTNLLLVIFIHNPMVEMTR